MGKYDWDALAENLRKDTLSDGKKVYESDDRFYKLARNENDTGGALLRLLPDPNNVMFIKMIRIAANNGYEKRFCTEWSPQTIGMPDPFNERWAKEYNAGNKEEAKRFGRSIRYITNVKVIKDPANPENEGKIFLLDMSQTIFEKIKNAASPSEEEIALGTEPKQVYNPLQGHNFLLKVKRGSNNFITYEDSKFDEKVTAAYESDEEFQKDIKENGYVLDDFYKPEFYKTYEELKEILAWYMNEKPTDSGTTETPAKEESVKEESVKEESVKETPVKEKPTKKESVKKESAKEVEQVDDDELDELLDSLM